MTKNAFRFASCLLLFLLRPVSAQTEDGRVTLPFQEWKTLWKAAQPEKEMVPKPPVSATLVEADYQLAFDGEYAVGTAEFSTQSFTKDWTAIPLLSAEIIIDRIEPADAQVALQNGSYVLITNRPGKAGVKFHFSSRLTSVGEGWRLEIKTPPALANRLKVTGIPANKSVRVPGATPVSSTEFQLPANGRLDLEILSVKTLAPPTLSRWKSEAQTMVQFADGHLKCHARIVVQADSGSGLEAAWRLPANARVQKIQGDDLGDWTVSNPDDRSRRIEVRWKTRDVLAREVEVTYDLPQAFSPGEWKLPAPEIENGEMADAIFALGAVDGMEFSLSRPDTEWVPGKVPRWLELQAGEASYLLVPADGVVQAKMLTLIRTAEAVIDLAEYRTRLVVDGSMLTEVNYTVRHDAPLPWQLQMPVKSELLACSVNGRPVNPIRRGEDLLELSLPNPSEKGLTEIKLTFTGRKPAFKPVAGQVEVELPRTDLLIHLVNWELGIPAAYEVAALQGNAEIVSGSAINDGASKVIHLRKELCKGEAPSVQIFYQKPQPAK